MFNFRFFLLALLFSMFSACGGSGGNTSTPTSMSTSASTPTSTYSKPIDIASFPGSMLLGKPTNNAITLSVVTTKNSKLNVDYGLTSEIYSNQSDTYDTVAGIPLEITLSGLSANTQYYYRLNYLEVGTAGFESAGEASFHTQRATGETFNFAIHADAHVGIRLRGSTEEEKADDDQYTRTLLNTLAFTPDFLIDLGDTFMSEKNWLKDYYDMTDGLDRTPPKETWVEEDYVFLRSFFNKIGHSVPLYLVNGNHEGEAGWEKHEEESVAIWANNLRNELFPVPSANGFYSGSTEAEPYAGKHNGYYSWKWGSALFVVLDPFWYGESKPKVGNEWAWTLGREQYDWLNTTLENSDARFKFIFLHNLVGGFNGEDGLGSGRGGALVASDWEWGGMDPNTGSNEFNEQRPGWGKPIHDVLVDHNVNVVFHGHDHVFVREDHPDGIIYQAVPQPSLLGETTGRAVKRANESGYDSNLGVVAGGSGFVNVSVSASSATISLIASNEDIATDNCIDSSCYETVYSYDLPGSTTPPTPIPTPTPTPTPTGNIAPAVSFITPVNSGALIMGNLVYVQVAATDTDGTVANVRLSLNGNFIRQENVSPYEWGNNVADAVLQNLSLGSHQLSAVATDNLGLTTTRTISINVIDGSTPTPTPTGNVPPVVSFVTPANGSTLIAGDLVYVQVGATDTDGTVSNVRLSLDGNFIRQENVSPYEWGNNAADNVLQNLSLGGHQLSAVATDDLGLTTTRTISINVISGATPTPTPTPTATPSSMTISSLAFKDTGSANTILPLSYTCDGKNGGTSPMLNWSGIPDTAVSLALTMHSSAGNSRLPNFTIFDISPTVTQLSASDMSIGKAALGDMSAAEIEQAGGIPYDAPCASGAAGSTKEYIFTLYALSNNLGLNAGANQADVLEAIEGNVISSTSLTTTRVHWDAQSIANDLHVPSSVPSTCDEKTQHFTDYSSVHKSISCDQASNQMDIVSHISDGLKTSLNDQQMQVGITRWIGRLSFPSQGGQAVRVNPSYLSGVNNNISCDGTGALGVSVDGQLILPYYKQTDDSGGNTCGPTDGTNYANRDTVVLGEVDQCYGHSPNGEGYHLHGAPICLMDVHDPSKPVAYMSDGIPLYFGEAGGTIENTAHGQSVNNPTDTNFGADLYDHLNYLPSDVKDGSNPLNDCNAYDLNGDGDKSGYVYYTTKDAPYAIGCFMGEVLSSPKPVQVTRTNFDGERQGWTGQTVGQGIDATIVSNYIGSYNNRLYNITELLVTADTTYLEEGDYAQVLWRVLEPNDPGYSQSSTCFELRYRANKQVTNSDETETICSRSQVPNETIDFTPFNLSDVSPETKSNVPGGGGSNTFKLEAWGDNWFAAYLGEDLIVEDSVPITTEKSFNSETATFNGTYPLHLNFVLKDFKENDTGLEYIGDANQQMGDGGFIAQITDTTSNAIIGVTNSSWKCKVIHQAPLDKTCEGVSNPVAGVAPCTFRISAEPGTWKSESFDDGNWSNATEHSAEDVGPKEGYDDIVWDSSAQFIWGPDLETDNTLLCRLTIQAP